MKLLLPALQLVELALDIGRRPIARFPLGDCPLADAVISREELDYMVNCTGEFGGDNRAGLPRTLVSIPEKV